AFENCLKFARKIGFANIHVFPYSRRQGTKAYPLPPIDSTVLAERVKRMTALKNELFEDYRMSFLGHTMDAVIETAGDYYSVGHTANYLKVYLPLSSNVKVGEIYSVQATELYKDGLLAKRQ
ncbi:MAG: tRNA (N(6)-L-threonylcarbamoyladenosine(37)-C(2))-methylthiotransferase MtaB, partial [Clostridia bacterium]|nr:tRNA (N(6)-L-threonylcarbamoyladenosine(37)-C(2))-methylthiotransferase MtaB [Clostridia bacterium]